MAPYKVVANSESDVLLVHPPSAFYSPVCCPSPLRSLPKTNCLHVAGWEKSRLRSKLSYFKDETTDYHECSCLGESTKKN